MIDYAMKLLRICCLLLFSLCTLYSLQAATVRDLYDAVVPIDGYKSANSKKVLSNGMLQVLIKATGNNQISEYPGVEEALENPEHYLLKFTHKIIEKVEENNIDGSEIKTRKLVSIQNYSQDRITELLKRLGLPVWGKQRPLTLAWVVIEFDPQNRLVLNDTDVTHFNNYYKQIISTESEKRGVPMAYPLQDLEEQLEISTSVIWAQFPNELRSASQRYAPDMILTGRLQAKDDSTWQGKWLIIGRDNTLEVITSAPNITANIQQGINWLADTLAKVYTTNLATSSEVVNIKISGINDLRAYTAVEKYISSLSAVEKFQITKVGSGYIELGILASEGKQALLSTFELDSKVVKMKVDNAKTKVIIESDAAQYSENSTVDPLQFRWRS